jgi:N-carbamoyl-L-amino-acid hydrolase
MDARRDAFLAAARSALAFREDAVRREDVRATSGVVRVEPGIVTAFNGACEISLDQRALDPAVLADMLATAQAESRRIAGEEACEVAWQRIWAIEPIPFAPKLIDLADTVVAELAGTSHRMPSGPLHDAAEMARLVPTVMLFVKSLRGLSHTNEEDTPVADLELSVRALGELTRRTLAWAS